MTENRAAQTLKRTLGLSGVVMIGIAWVTPLIVLATIGIIARLWTQR
jgi:putrescine importer